MIQHYSLRKTFNWIGGAILLCFPFHLNASFYDFHAQGWHWYENTQVEEKQHQDMALSSLSPVEAVGVIKKDLKIKRARAVLYPSEENVYEYIKTQEKWAAQAELFASMWQRVVMKYPDLNYNLKHPTSELAKRIEQTEKVAQLKEALSFIRKEYGLFYFYRSDCTYCKKFSPILKAFAQENHLSILPISLDGGENEVFKHFKRDNGIAKEWGVAHVPALFAVSPHHKEVIPVGFGLMSQMDLEQRFLMLANYQKEKGHASLGTGR